MERDACSREVQRGRAGGRKGRREGESHEETKGVKQPYFDLSLYNNAEWRVAILIVTDGCGCCMIHMCRAYISQMESISSCMNQTFRVT